MEVHRRKDSEQEHLQVSSQLRALWRERWNEQAPMIQAIQAGVREDLEGEEQLFRRGLVLPHAQAEGLGSDTDRKILRSLDQEIRKINGPVRAKVIEHCLPDAGEAYVRRRLRVLFRLRLVTQDHKWGPYGIPDRVRELLRNPAGGVGEASGGRAGV